MRRVKSTPATRRVEYFLTANLAQTPVEIQAADTGRWAINVMFQESREHLGLE
ncbi:MAG: hypothetical protein ACK5Q5_15805 [Planctomycetaceae bacterium]